jgi:hypothetical protein
MAQKENSRRARWHNGLKTLMQLSACVPVDNDDIQVFHQVSVIEGRGLFDPAQLVAQQIRLQPAAFHCP